MTNPTPATNPATASPADTVDTVAQLTSRTLKWLLAGHLSGLAASFTAFGVAVLLQQSAASVTNEAIHGQGLTDAEAEALIARVNDGSSRAADSWLTVSWIAWLCFLVFAVIISVVLFLTTKGRMRERLATNGWLYTFVWTAALGAASALALAALSNALIAHLSAFAPWVFFAPRGYPSRRRSALE
ncbi:hypothetical protein [Curtobacterium sp. MCJR17_043]|uniref:hypothetical protein n=1 Tax=Curtobacterium sp. MCJR17_043 TaxID=2175660 RepID=UPI0024E02A03|nr:hypothetical protein [Curtobacterium sp. MCJR17_043]WIB36373.1 hypothetical protein DEJ15_04225 [Curtobacterium sp. MCJR17_043]